MKAWVEEVTNITPTKALFRSMPTYLRTCQSQTPRVSQKSEASPSLRKGKTRPVPASVTVMYCWMTSSAAHGQLESFKLVTFQGPGSHFQHFTMSFCGRKP